jgi:hypothetical protein
MRKSKKMSRTINRIRVSFAPILLLASVLSTGAFAQQSATFTPGNLVVSVEGCGVHGGTCTAVSSGTGTGGGYGDNQAAPFTLFQYTPNGTASVTYVNSLVLPQAISGANFPVSGEYGSSSEGTLQLSGNGQYLTLMGYGVNAAAFDAAYLPGFTTDLFGAAPSGALGQSGSLTGQSYTTVPRVVALIDPFGNINSSTALSNIFNTNNPRSIFTTDGLTSAYVSGQGSGCDATGGVFYTVLGAPNSAPTAITGLDAKATSSCTTMSTIAQDTRDVQIHNNTLYISIDSTEGKSDNRSLIGTLGTPPATSLFTPTAAPTGDTGGPNLITGLGNTGGTGKETIAGNGNSLNAGLGINLSPENYFFATPAILYVADSGSPKQSSATSLLGDGGLQKWINSAADGTGTWSLAYTLYKGLNLVANAASTPANVSGTTGLYGLTGTLASDGTVNLYATNFTIADLDPTFLYGITDTLSTTTDPGTTFTQLEAAPQDSNFKGVSFAPSLPGTEAITSSPSGLTFTSAGTGCAAGTYTTPVTLVWTPGNTCTLSVVSPQAGATGTQYAFAQWQDSTTNLTDGVTAPATTEPYLITFTTQYQLTTTAGTGGTISAGGYLNAGTNATITATPSAGSYFVNFTGATTSTTNPLALAMTGPESITANFAALIAPTLTFAPISPQIEDAAAFAVSATSASSGAVTYAVMSGPATISSGNMVTVTGTGTVVLTASQAASGDFNSATATTSFTVSAPFTLTASNASASVAPGAAASFSLMLTPPAGATTFSAPITLAATGLPPGATATFSLATIASGSGAATVTLNIQTAAQTSGGSSPYVAHNERPLSGNPLLPVSLGFLLLPLLGITSVRKRLRQMPRLPLVLLVAGLSLAAVLGISGCSGSGAAPAAPQSYTVVVTATDTTTNVTGTANLTLTVQ